MSRGASAWGRHAGPDTRPAINESETGPVVPDTFSRFISLFKDTTPVALVGITNLFGIGRATLGNPDWMGTHRKICFFIGALFRVMNYTLSYGSRKLEQSLNTDNPNRDQPLSVGHRDIRAWPTTRSLAMKPKIMLFDESAPHLIRR